MQLHCVISRKGGGIAIDIGGIGHICIIGSGGVVHIATMKMTIRGHSLTVFRDEVIDVRINEVIARVTIYNTIITAAAVNVTNRRRRGVGRNQVVVESWGVVGGRVEEGTDAFRIASTLAEQIVTCIIFLCTHIYS